MPLTHHRFTADEFQRMVETRILTEEDRVELLDGTIVEMTPIGRRHSACVNRLTRDLIERLGRAATVSVQHSVVLTDTWQPQPDVAVLKPREDGYATRLPTADDVLLLIEVAESSVERDHTVKLPGYAASRVREVWIANLVDDRVEVSREPGADRYRSRTNHARGDLLSPLAFPGLKLPVAEILGPVPA